MIKVLSLFISFFSIVMALVTIIQGIRAAYDQWDKTVNKYEYLKNRNVNDWDIREGFPHEIYGLVPVKYWKRVLVCFFINGVSGVIFRFSL